MPVLDIYKQNIKTIYKTTFLSKTTLFVLITSCATMILPFIFAYRSRGFWLKHDTFYEQPNVKFKGEYLLIGFTTNESNIVICNNFHNFKVFDEFDLCTNIKLREIDQNYDKKVDILDFQVDIDLPEKESLTYISLVLTMDYELNTVCPLVMQSAVILQHNIQHPKALDIFADLQLAQKYPLACFYKGRDNNYNHSIITDDLDMRSFRIEYILNQYLHRNMSTHLNNVYAAFQSTTSDTFELNLRIAIPEHKIYYKPRFWQVMKWAWIQYFAIYIIFSWIFHKINNYVFEHNLVLFYKVCPVTLNKKIF